MRTRGEPSVRDFVRDVAAARIGTTFNFYRDGEGAEERRARLERYLVERAGAGLLLVGEAPGYRGARVSGIPFTSERQLTGAGPAEATATVVQRILRELAIEPHVLCWNTVPTHPHLPGQPTSNRPPTAAEVAAAAPFLARLASGRRVVAVGRVAARALPGAPAIRHPARGGAAAFRDGLLKYLV